MQADIWGWDDARVGDVLHVKCWAIVLEKTFLRVSCREKKNAPILGELFSRSPLGRRRYFMPLCSGNTVLGTSFLELGALGRAM